MSRAVRAWRFGRPVLRSGLGLPGCWVAHGGVGGCWVVSRLQVNALCCAACRTGRASRATIAEPEVQSTFFLAYPLKLK